MLSNGYKSTKSVSLLGIIEVEIAIKTDVDFTIRRMRV
jgi:hypothetical protein